MANEKTAQVIVVTFLLARLCTYMRRLIIAHCCFLAVHMAWECIVATGLSQVSLSGSYNEGAVVLPLERFIPTPITLSVVVQIQ